MRRVLSFFTMAVILFSFGTTSFAVPVAVPRYPRSISYGDFDAKSAIRRAYPVDTGYVNEIMAFACRTAYDTVGGRTGNWIYSPIGLYSALSITAAGADGDTRKEILDALGMSDRSVNYLAMENGNLFRQIYTANDVGSLKYDSSVWLKKGLNYQNKFIDSATRNYYASIHTVEFANVSASEEIENWIATNMGSPLRPSVLPNAENVLSIFNTATLTDQWDNPFDKTKTTEGTFYTVGGDTVTCDFMTQVQERHGYTKGDGFTRSSIGLKNAGRMIFILPDEDVTVNSLLSTYEKTRTLFTGSDTGSARVVFEVPKFYSSTELHTNELLAKMGIETAFSAQADFSNLLTSGSVQLSGIQQNLQFSIDENGIRSDTPLAQQGIPAQAPVSGLPTVQMKLNRPFLFAVVSNQGVPLFIGVISNPIAKP